MIVAVVFASIFVSRKWGAAGAESKARQKVIKAGERRKAIDRDIQNLSPDELIDRLRRGL